MYNRLQWAAPCSEGARLTWAPTVFCPNCMSPYVEAIPQDALEEEGQPPPDEPLLRCTECEYTAPRSEFVPENYR
jgi:hypothetical protein